MAAQIPVRRTTQPKAKPQGSDLGFGKYFTDHMFLLDYTAGKGWHDPRIVAQGPLPIDPACGGLQYGQSIFEGMKAFRGPKGAPVLFRPASHAARLNASAKRLCMPEADPAMVVDAITQLVALDKEWMPTAPGTSIYVRPTMFATEAYFGVRPSNEYLLAVILSPVASYWHDKTKSLRIWAEREYVRAAKGGIGFAKAGGNYGSSLLAAEQAKKNGYDQVLWLDGHEHQYVEEIGTMNFFVVMNGEVVTPPLEGTILAGVTRDSVLTLLREAKVPVSERPIRLEEIVAAHFQGKLQEVFATGTASSVAPIGEIGWDGGKLTLEPSRSMNIANRMREELTAIQHGAVADSRGWIVPVP